MERVYFDSSEFVAITVRLKARSNAWILRLDSEYRWNEVYFDSDGFVLITISLRIENNRYKKNHQQVVILIFHRMWIHLVEAEGVEPSSENTSQRASPETVAVLRFSFYTLPTTGLYVHDSKLYAPRVWKPSKSFPALIDAHSH